MKYSKVPFGGYTHRFIVKFCIDEDWRNDTKITIYSDSKDYDDLTEFIDEIKNQS